jgi:hypothetical protein
MGEKLHESIFQTTLPAVRAKDVTEVLTHKGREDRKQEALCRWQLRSLTFTRHLR